MLYVKLHVYVILLTVKLRTSYEQYKTPKKNMQTLLNPFYIFNGVFAGSI